MLIRRGNATKFMSGEGISIDQITGDPYFTGTFQNIVDAPFQYGTINNLPNFSENSAYLIGLDINTFNGWSRYANAPFGNTYGKSVVFKDNHVFYTGNYSRNDIDIELIGSFPYITSGMPINNHIFIACYESPGGGVWGNVTTDPVSNTGVHNAMSITANNQGKAFVVGSYFKAMDYFMTSSSPQLNSTGIGNNGFILRVEINTGNLFIVNDEPLVKLNDKTISSLEIAIAPNPTSGQANCVIQNYDSRKAYQIKIHDPLGKIIYESSPTFGTFNIDLSNQKNGLYFIQLYDGTLTTYTKIVKTD